MTEWTAQRVLDFWFDPATEKNWFVKSDEFDARVRDTLIPAYELAAGGAFDDWARTGKGAVALCVLLDQFPRNVFRGSPQSFATDPQALAITRQALAEGLDQSLSANEKLFLYLPLEHDEDMASQTLCCQLMRERIGRPDLVDYADRHRVIIERFGRFPHRNAVLDRPNTAEETAFLKEPGSSF